jgi:chemotaxis protein MotB
MASTQESPVTKAVPGAMNASLYNRSISGFRNWWAQRSFRLAPGEARAEVPPGLRDAAVQFSSRVWEIAQNQAHAQLAGERATVNERVAEANNKVAAAVLARGRAENHSAQLEKRVAAAEKARQDLEKQLTDAGARHKEQQSQLAAQDKSRAELQRRLDDASARESELQKQLAALRAEIAEHDAKSSKFEEQQQQQLEKAKQHYASLESRLASLLEEHKSARQGFEKSPRR